MPPKRHAHELPVMPISGTPPPPPLRAHAETMRYAAIDAATRHASAPLRHAADAAVSADAADADATFFARYAAATLFAGASTRLIIYAFAAGRYVAAVFRHDVSCVSDFSPMRDASPLPRRRRFFSVAFSTPPRLPCAAAVTLGDITPVASRSFHF
jgi:hypothetical protein